MNLVYYPGDDPLRLVRHHSSVYDHVCCLSLGPACLPPGRTAASSACI